MSEDIRLQMALEDLSSSDAETRLAAMQMLGQARHRPAIPALVAALSDADANIRAAADEALRKIGGLASLSLLLDLLRTDDLPEKARIIDLSHELIRGFWRELHDGAAAS
jgi:HEAT repeat protein